MIHCDDGLLIYFRNPLLWADAVVSRSMYVLVELKHKRIQSKDWIKTSLFPVTWEYTVPFAKNMSLQRVFFVR